MGTLNNLVAGINLTVGDMGLLYKGFYVLGFLTIVAFSFFYRSKYGIKKREAIFGDGTVLSVDLWLGICFGMDRKFAYGLGTS